MPGAKFACEEALDRAFALKRRATVKRRRSVAPRMTDAGESPMRRQLRETETWTRDEMHIFPHLPTARERVAFVYDFLPDDATGLDRLWPIAIVQKDSRQGTNINTALNHFNTSFTRRKHPSMPSLRELSSFYLSSL